MSCHEKLKHVPAIVAILLCVFAPTAVYSWSPGSRAHAVVLRGSTVSVESGRITALHGGLGRVMWDRCNCETLVPVRHLHRSLGAATAAGAQRNTGGMSFNDSAERAGKMGLLYLLLSRRGGK